MTTSNNYAVFVGTMVQSNFNNWTLFEIRIYDNYLTKKQADIIRERVMSEYRGEQDTAFIDIVATATFLMVLVLLALVLTKRWKSNEKHD